MSRIQRVAHAPVATGSLSSRILIGLLLLAGVCIAVYPMTARWFSQLTQSELIGNYGVEMSEVGKAERQATLDAAREYNNTLNAGAAFDPFTQGIAGLESPQYQDYLGHLEGIPTGVMARVLIPAIEVDLPIYHGTTDTVLHKGVGHLFGTALPVGGEGTRSTLTAHSGLADAVLFTFLERLKPGDIFHIEVYGERLTYRIFEIKVIEPDESDQIAPEAGRDLVTLVTCTPIGVNSQRLIVTGERIETIIDEDNPVPAETELPGFLWWAVILGVSALIVLGYIVFGGHRGGRHRAYLDDHEHDSLTANELGDPVQADPALLGEKPTTALEPQTEPAASP